ncbi:EAL domain-containing protein [Crenobacter intestini]|uniref:EAL domain-containing protein n=2 Tax=Crenobacter intestini TaxID=2563443 RepID=A0A4T0V364_9NEIS|nr:EAL domain-containing protein [Crenobacter intestini]
MPPMEPDVLPPEYAAALPARLVPSQRAQAGDPGTAEPAHAAGLRHTDESELLAARQRSQLLWEQSALGMVEWDEGFRVREWNPAAERIFGYTRDEALGQHAHFILPDTVRNSVSREVLDILLAQQGGSYSLNANLHRDGRVIQCEWFNTSLVDENGQTLGVTSLVQDVSEREAAQTHNRYLAEHDELTGLYNRKYLSHRAEHAISLASAQQPLALAFIDLDNFKHVNDTLGHSAGDRLLCLLAARIGAQLRAHDCAARQGGDEFILLLPDTTLPLAGALLDELAAALAAPCHIDGHEICVTVSIGVACYPQDGEDFDTLLRSADMAMYDAKRDGKNTWRGFRAPLRDRASRQMLLESALHRALARDELSLHYQPQFALGSQQLLGFEALLRWHSEDLGTVSPVEFIPVAESCGLIAMIGDWVLQEALRQLSRWQAAGFAPVPVAVNLSAAQFLQSDLAERIARALDAHAVDAALLELELTESVAMQRPEEALEQLAALHALGIRVSIDDFGTGYSSLSYLKRFRLDRLKIDRSFVADIVEDHEDRAIVEAVIRMAGALGLKTLAEGLETPEQLAWLTAQGCDAAQGYLLGRPAPAGEATAWLRAQAVATT